MPRAAALTGPGRPSPKISSGSMTGRPSSGVRCAQARGRPVSAPRSAYRAERAGERRAELTELGGQPAEAGIGGPDLGRGLAAFGLVDAVIRIDHHRLPGDPSWTASGSGPAAP